MRRSTYGSAEPRCEMCTSIPVQPASRQFAFPSSLPAPPPLQLAACSSVSPSSSLSICWQSARSRSACRAVSACHAVAACPVHVDIGRGLKRTVHRVFTSRNYAGLIMTWASTSVSSKWRRERSQKETIWLEISLSPYQFRRSYGARQGMTVVLNHAVVI